MTQVLPDSGSAVRDLVPPSLMPAGAGPLLLDRQLAAGAQVLELATLLLGVPVEDELEATMWIRMCLDAGVNRLMTRWRTGSVASVKELASFLTGGSPKTKAEAVAMIETSCGQCSPASQCPTSCGAADDSIEWPMYKGLVEAYLAKVKEGRRREVEKKARVRATVAS